MRSGLAFPITHLSKGGTGTAITKLVTDFKPNRLIVVADASRKRDWIAGFIARVRWLLFGQSDSHEAFVCLRSIMVAEDEMVQGSGDGIIHHVFLPTSVDCGIKWTAAKTGDEISLQFVNVGPSCRVFATMLGDDPLPEVSR